MMVLRMGVMTRVTVMLASEAASAASRGWRTCKAGGRHCWGTDSAS